MLAGQETLLASWRALAQTSAGARLTESAGSVAAVFPAWEPLNNAILLTTTDSAAADLSAAASQVAPNLADLYADAGVRTWALWLPSPLADLDTPDAVRRVDGLTRDTTTLVMQASLRPGRSRHDGVVRASLSAAIRAGDEPVPVADLGAPEETPGLTAWVMLQDDAAVASAWTFRHGTDCGVYAVATVPGWRRRGLATGLLQHVLAVAEDDGARTATLQSTRMAVHLYASLGFVAAGRYEEWASR